MTGRCIRIDAEVALLLLHRLITGIGLALSVAIVDARAQDAQRPVGQRGAAPNSAPRTGGTAPGAGQSFGKKVLAYKLPGSLQMTGSEPPTLAYKLPGAFQMTGSVPPTLAYKLPGALQMVGRAQ